MPQQPQNKNPPQKRKRSSSAVEEEGIQRLQNLSEREKREEELFRIRKEAAELDVFKKKKEIEHMEKMNNHELEKAKEEMEFLREKWKIEMKNLIIGQKKEE